MIPGVGGGVGGYSWKFRIGVCGPSAETLTLFKDQKSGKLLLLLRT